MAEGRAYRVRGRVQGVGFRWWAHRAAVRLALRGTVRNASDGSVLLEAWGDAGPLGELERMLAAGPVGARVDAVEQLDPPARPEPAEFTIER
jgi:acylphosphatase